MEEWRTIWEHDSYQVSNLGNARNYKTGRILKLQSNHEGYLSIGIYLNGRLKILKVHRLVAQAFLDNMDNKCCVNHIDSNKTNNRLDNLEWVTHKENTQHSIRQGNFSVPTSERLLLKYIQKLQSEHNFILISEMVEYLQTKSVLSAL